MRVLTVIPELGVGGAEGIALTLATAGAARGDEIWLASGPGHRIAALAPGGVRHVPVPLVGRGPASLIRTVRRLRSLPLPDLVHAHNPKATLAAGLAFGGRVPVLTTLHGVAEHDRRHASVILRSNATRVAVVSEHLGAALERDGYPRERIDVVPSGTVPLPAYPRERARAELGIAQDEIVALCLARMVPQKRHDLLVRAWSAVSDRAVLLLAGDGPRRSRVERAVDDAGLGHSVRSLGARSDVPRLLAASDFLVLPTDWEGLPISLLEALAAGVPALVSRVSGLADHFDGGVHFVEPASVPALAAGLLAMVDGAEARRGTAAERPVASFGRFSPEAMLERYDELYRHVAGPLCDERVRAGDIR